MNLTFKIALLLILGGAVLMSCDRHSNNHTEGVYACPMHPEITGKKGEKCTKCGMDLEAVKEINEEKYRVRIISEPSIIAAGKPITFTLAITEKGQNAALEISHEKDIHLIMVSDDLNWFRHVHPEEQANGTYNITETFPHGGKFILFTDFKPKGFKQTLHKHEIEVQGNSTKDSDTVLNKWISNVDGYTVTLANGNDFKTNTAQHFDISIERNEKDLSAKQVENYLGAVAHIILVGKTNKEFLHVHPTSSERFPIHGETLVKNPGIYRMWVQFQTNGQVHTADFTIHIIEGDKMAK